MENISITKAEILNPNTYINKISPHTMSTYSKILYQVVFGGKYCSHFLNSFNQDQLFTYMAQLLSQRNCHPYIVGGHCNHIHMVFSLHSSISLSILVKEVKTLSNRFMKNQPDVYSGFNDWQKGYGAFTYNFAAKNRLINYVKNQETHHSQKTYEEELIDYLRNFKIEFDERYLLE